MQVPSKAASIFSGIFIILFGCAFAGIGIFSAAATLGQSESSSDDNIPVLLSAIFAVIGIAIIIGGFYSFSHGAKLRARAAKYPGQPWMLKENWASGRIKDSGVVGMLVLVAFAVLWNAMTWIWVASMLFSGTFKEEKFSLFALVPLLIGLGIGGFALYLFLRWRKYGVSVFEMAEVPGVLGGSLGGVVMMRSPVRATDGFRLLLRSMHRWSSGTGKNRKTHTETLWEREQTLPTPDSRFGQRMLPVLFTIPYDCQPTHKFNSNKEHYWELVVTGKSPGIDYKASFVVPVFKTESSSPNVTGELEHLPEDEQAVIGSGIAAIPGVRVLKTLSGGEQLEFTTPADALITAIVTLIVALGMLAVAAVLLVGALSWLFGAILAIGGLYAGYRALHSLFGTTIVTLYPDRIEIQRRRFGFKGLPRVIRRDRLESIEATSRHASNTNRLYTLLVRSDGQTTRLPLHIRGQSQAELIAAHIRKKP